MHPSRQISRGLLLRAKEAPLQAWRHQFSLRDRRPAFFNPFPMKMDLAGTPDPR